MNDDPPAQVEIPEPDIGDDWEQDTLSTIEEEHWDEYAEITRQKRVNTLKIHKVFGWTIPVAISLSFLFFVIVLGVYVAHLVIPAGRRWLTADELQHIHGMLFSGVVGGAIAVAAKTYFFEDKGKVDDKQR